MANSRALVLNELSFVEGQVRADVLANLARVLSSVRALTSSVYLVSSIVLWGNGINPHGTLGAWASDPAHRDGLRQILAFQNRAPYDEFFGNLDPTDSTEYLLFEKVCVGLGYAHANHQIGLSLLVDPMYKVPFLPLQKWALDPLGADFVATAVEVRHLATQEHVAIHQDWLVTGDAVLSSGAQLWALRSILLPRVIMLDRVEIDLGRLQTREFAAVLERLRELQSALDEWNEVAETEPPWKSKITPESDSRIQAGVCSFRNASGESEVFSWHARYTPGAGRIHFAISRSRRMITVAYVGQKLS